MLVVLKVLKMKVNWTNKVNTKTSEVFIYWAYKGQQNLGIKSIHYFSVTYNLISFDLDPAKYILMEVF